MSDPAYRSIRSYVLRQVDHGRAGPERSRAHTASPSLPEHDLTARSVARAEVLDIGLPGRNAAGLPPHPATDYLGIGCSPGVAAC
jgi:hypothetical protein